MRKAALAAIAFVALVALAACGSATKTKTVTTVAATPAAPTQTATTDPATSGVAPCTSAPSSAVTCDPQGAGFCPMNYSVDEATHGDANCWQDDTTTNTGPSQNGPTASADDGSGDSTLFDDGSGDSSTGGPLTASLGKALPLQNMDSDVINVNVQSVRPFSAGEFDSPDAGKHYVGVLMRYHNVSSATFEDSPDNEVTMIASNGDSFDSTIVGSGCDNDSNMHIGPGDSRNACVAFEVPDGVKLSKVQVQLDSGYGNNLGEWKVS